MAAHSPDALHFQMEEFEKEPNAEDAAALSRDAVLRQYSFYQLRIHLKCGRNLIAKDKNGECFTFVHK